MNVNKWIKTANIYPKINSDYIMPVSGNDSLIRNTKYYPDLKEIYHHFTRMVIGYCCINLTHWSRS